MPTGAVLESEDLFVGYWEPNQCGGPASREAVQGVAMRYDT